MRDFTIFLLSFILRDSNFRDAKIVDEIRSNPWMPLNLSRATPGSSMVNDLELIPLRTTPMIKVNAIIDDIPRPGTAMKRQKIVTNPLLGTIHTDLFSVIQTTRSSL